MNQTLEQTSKAKLAVITGASSGIGFELAKQFASHGYDLLIVSADDRIHQTADGLKEFGTEVQSFKCDLTDAQCVIQVYREIKQTGRPVDALVLNAGVGVNGRFWETEYTEELNLIELNVISTVHLAKLVVRDMVTHKQGGDVLITSSVAAEAPGPYMAVYNASKAFVQSFAEALHYELKEYHINVTALMPDATDTEFFDRADMRDTEIGAGAKDDPALVAKQGFEALMNKKDHVLGGSLTHRMKNSMMDFIPEQTKAKMYGEGAKPGSASKEQKKQAS